MGAHFTEFTAVMAGQAGPDFKNLYILATQLHLCIIFAFMRLKINWDALGITASVACAVHCAVLPLLLSSFPIFGFDIIRNTLFEYGMIALAFVVGAYALSHGFRKHHHRFLPLTIFSIGILFLFAKQVWHTLHLLFLVPAVMAIISAHYLNYRFCRIHNHAHAEDCAH